MVVSVLLFLVACIAFFVGMYTVNYHVDKLKWVNNHIDVVARANAKDPARMFSSFVILTEEVLQLCSDHHNRVDGQRKQFVSSYINKFKTGIPSFSDEKSYYDLKELCEELNKVLSMYQQRYWVYFFLKIIYSSKQFADAIATDWIKTPLILGLTQGEVLSMWRAVREGKDMDWYLSNIAGHEYFTADTDIQPPFYKLGIITSEEQEANRKCEGLDTVKLFGRQFKYKYLSFGILLFVLDVVLFIRISDTGVDVSLLSFFIVFFFYVMMIAEALTGFGFFNFDSISCICLPTVWEKCLQSRYKKILYLMFFFLLAFWFSAVKINSLNLYVQKGSYVIVEAKCDEPYYNLDWSKKEVKNEPSLDGDSVLCEDAIDNASDIITHDTLDIRFNLCIKNILKSDLTYAYKNKALYCLFKNVPFALPYYNEVPDCIIIDLKDFKRCHYDPVSTLYMKYVYKSDGKADCIFITKKEADRYRDSE